MALLSVTSLKNLDDENFLARHKVPEAPREAQIPVKNAVPWKRGRGEYVRRGKYFFGFDMSREVGVAVTHIWWLRIAQALGLPVVPEVKIRAERSRGVAFAGGEMAVGVGRSLEVR